MFRSHFPLLVSLTALSLLVSACGSDDKKGDTVGVDGSPNRDADGDGFPESTDCDDDDAAINPDADEVCGDGVDNDCNGQADTEVQCLGDCGAAAASNSYFGCDFYGADLPQAIIASSMNRYGLGITNPSTTEAATVTVSNLDRGLLETISVPAQGVATFEEASRADHLLFPGISGKAFHIESDIPVAVYQFNSLDTTNAASTDASMLFASHNLATDYTVVDYDSGTYFSTPEGPNGDTNFIAVYAVENDTAVTITAIDTIDGPSTATLQAGEILMVNTPEGKTTLTGSRVSSDKPVGVFSGNRCANVPADLNACDHLEQQLFPRTALGARYIVGKSRPRTSCDPLDYLRIVADQDGTEVTITPSTLAPFTLNEGEYLETTISESVEVSASLPIQVAQYLRSSGGAECKNEGDPAMALQVPVDQFRSDYIFFTPSTYSSDFVDIVAPSGTELTLDGEIVPLSGDAIAGTNFTLTSIALSEGSHTIVASKPVGAMVYGFGGPSPPEDARNVSYMYPAGLNLKPINEID